jgi:lycopene cyclase domain-containing protein
LDWLYLALNVGSVSIPLAFSFDKRIHFYKNWKYLFPALICVATFFVIWDFWFTEIGVWKFNHMYVLGIDLVNLPLEELMFFIFIPYACMFIYESLKYYFPKDPFERVGRPVAIILGITCLAIAFAMNDRMYTAVTLILLGMFLLLNVFAFHSWFLGRFFLMYLVSLIPFGIVNGVLTAMPVLIYNDFENSGIRIGTIPVEDAFYSMLMLLMNVTIYEHLKSARTGRAET